MDLKRAKKILNESKRHEIRDHAFGDMEVMWTKDGNVIANGTFGRTVSEVVMVGAQAFFIQTDAHALKECGELIQVERNDTTGPDDFVLGRCMPGLTREGVHDELVRHNVFEDEKNNL